VDSFRDTVQEQLAAVADGRVRARSGAPMLRARRADAAAHAAARRQADALSEADLANLHKKRKLVEKQCAPLPARMRSRAVRSGLRIAGAGAACGADARGAAAPLLRGAGRGRRTGWARGRSLRCRWSSPLRS
jgi:hypothetical protein